MATRSLVGLLLPAFAALVSGQKDPHWVNGHNTIVHLFEWKFSDIALECERFLGPKGYAGVQTSPVNEYIENVNNNPSRPWHERYQPISYNIVSRSGDEAAFANMVERCNNVGVRIYVDAVINHMSASIPNVKGYSGRSVDTSNKYYPDVPYTSEHFHDTCSISNYNDASNVRNCELVGLHDLDHSQDYVRQQIIKFLNKLVDLGVAGFRVDAAKHMWPSDLRYIYSQVKNLNTKWFPENSRPFFYQEVIDYGSEAVKISDYTELGTVTEFKFGKELSNAFKGNNPIRYLKNWGSDWGLVDSADALVFIDNHDNQRGSGGGGDILTYKDAKTYKMATAFMLAWPYGITQVMSSFYFTDSEAGPPASSDGTILDVTINSDGTCGNGWVCEHRWRQIYNMVAFKNICEGTPVQNWWDNGDKQIAFCRGDVGFIAFNNQPDVDLKQRLPVSLPTGTYCDMISGSKEYGKCSGKSVTVNSDGTAYVEILKSEDDGILAITKDSKL